MDNMSISLQFFVKVGRLKSGNFMIITLLDYVDAIYIDTLYIDDLYMLH